jgi:hypothetical protein
MSDLKYKNTWRSLSIVMSSDFESRKGEFAGFVVIFPFCSDINA